MEGIIESAATEELARLREECKLSDQRAENQSRFHDAQLRLLIAMIQDNTGERLKVAYEDGKPYEFWPEDDESEDNE